MGCKGTWREIQAAERRQQRDAHRRHRELERQAQEVAKLSLAEQARHEVEKYENSLDVLLSIHKERGDVWDWAAIASTLPPPPPFKHSFQELRARQAAFVKTQETSATIEQARKNDELAFSQATQEYASQINELESLKSLAQRILAKDHKAYIEALVKISPLAELSDLGSQLHFTVHHARLVECGIKVAGTRVIPTEVKSLTSSGKVSVKPMPKGRFHEIYQDYICSCMLRVAREVFALLPVNTLLVTASADLTDAKTGVESEQPVLSAVMPRTTTEQLHFEQLEPSNALDVFEYRGDFKASRKEGAFKAITPFAPDDITHHAVHELSFHELETEIRKLKELLNGEINDLKNASVDVASHSN
jgi:hypothetical protein